jgi:hypothetical protein
LSLVLPEFRPTLRDELARLRPRWRTPVTALLILIAVLALLLLLKGSSQPGTHVVHQGQPAFNLRFTEPLRRVKTGPGELLHLEWREEGVLRASFVVEPLKLPPFTGDVGGVEPVEEGKARVNQVPAYSSTFRASRKPRMYGRVVLLAEPVSGSRDGFRIVMLATPKGGADKAGDVAARGVLKTAYRTFRFGTEGP